MDYEYSVYFTPSKEVEPGSFGMDDAFVLGYLNKERVDWCEKVLQKFYFVKWDRFICDKAVNGSHVLTCYGWIDRAADSYKDFVALHLLLDSKKVLFALSSSSEYNARITKMCGEISGFRTALQKKCTRIEDVFSVPNMTKMNGGAKQPG